MLPELKVYDHGLSPLAMQNPYPKLIWAPEYLSDLLIKSEQIKNLRSNDKEILKVPFSKTAYYDRSFSVSGA